MSAENDSANGAARQLPSEGRMCSVTSQVRPPIHWRGRANLQANLGRGPSRDMLSTLATEVLGEVFATAECPVPLRPVRAALAGLGRPGLAHAAVLSAIPGCELVGLADARRDARREAAGLGFRTAGFARLEKLIEKFAPEAVLLSATHPDGVSAARTAIEAGAAALVDGPLDMSCAEADDLIARAVEKERALVFAVPFVHHPIFGQVPRILGAGLIGRPLSARGSVLASRMTEDLRAQVRGKSRNPGGVLTRLASNLLYLLVWYMGQPQTVRATWTRHGDHPEDEISAVMRLAEGLDVSLDASWQTSGYPRPATVIEVEGENGKLLASDDTIELDLAEPRGSFSAGSTRLAPGHLPQIGRFDQDGDALYVQDASFLAWATGGAAPPDRAAAVRQVLAVRDAFYGSAAANGAEHKVVA